MSNIFKIIPLQESQCWDEIIKSFRQFDVYYLSGYVKAFKTHGDGEPILIYYDTERLKGMSVMMKRDIADDSFFSDKIPRNFLFDLVSPYGYGGFIFEGEVNEENISAFYKQYVNLLKSENIVSSFVRYHPMLQNADYLRSVEEIIDLGKTIHIDLASKDIIWTNITSKNRNVIRKAKKRGVTIHHGKNRELFDHFMNIYNQTMSHNGADNYYYFERSFYESIHNDLHDNYEIFFALYQDIIIAMSIILYANNQMHYHLSGSLYEYRKLAPTNLLLYEAALWGHDQGFKSFHLGGGIGSAKDGLFDFKQSFNRYSANQFSIGKLIVMKDKYNELVEMREKADNNFYKKSSFFPLYRA